MKAKQNSLLFNMCRIFTKITNKVIMHSSVTPYGVNFLDVSTKLLTKEFIW